MLNAWFALEFGLGLTNCLAAMTARAATAVPAARDAKNQPRPLMAKNTKIPPWNGLRDACCHYQGRRSPPRRPSSTG